jgi:hypothetical protein
MAWYRSYYLPNDRKSYVYCVVCEAFGGDCLTKEQCKSTYIENYHCSTCKTTGALRYQFEYEEGEKINFPAIGAAQQKNIMEPVKFKEDKNAISKCGSNKCDGTCMDPECLGTPNYLCKN